MNKRRMVLIGAALILLPIVGVVTWTKATLWYVYSSGERAGFLQKLSHKGWLCKTWEGELAMVNIPGAMQERFEFTVRDDLIAQHLLSSMGKRVSVSYEQHKGIPTTCFGETEYFVTAVRVLE